MVYRSVVLGVLLYGAETWAPPKSWLVGYTGSTNDVFVQSRVLADPFSGRNTLLLLS